MDGKKKRRTNFASVITGVIPSYKGRVAIISVGLLLGMAYLLFTSNMARQQREKEKKNIELWGEAISLYGRSGINDVLLDRIVNTRDNIPMIMLEISNDRVVVRDSRNIPDHILHHPGLLHKKLRQLERQNKPLKITAWNGLEFYIYHGNSKLQKTLVIFPLIQIGVLFIFMVFGFITIGSSKEDEKNKVWIGLAKETAHQLGTPISSLLGWVEYMRAQSTDQMAVDEMEADLNRLMKVADRFSKIGADTILTPSNTNEIVGGSVMYFRSRVPKKVTLDYNGFAIAPITALINSALFEWVVENLMKNALDALHGQGKIDVTITSGDEWVYIDVADNGKGIPKSNFKRIFEPGFTTKTRGWGLGLSLSKRIIEEYHKGKIFVLDSEPGKGTTMRIALKRFYD